MTITLKNSNFEINITCEKAYMLYEMSDLINLCKDGTNIIFLPDYVSEESMNYILDFCDIYRQFDDISFPITDRKFQTFIGDDIYTWLLLLKRKHLFDLLNCANCLCIDSLIEILSIKIFLDIKDMSPNDAKLYFTCI